MTARHRSLHGFLYEFSNFGRLPVPALRSLVEQLTQVEVPKGEAIIREGDPPGAMFILEKGRARAFHSHNGTQQNLAFYRDGDFFGELSILNGSPRAASVEAFSDCRLLALEPNAVRDLKRRYPEFGKLMEERLAQYQAKTEARVPLDFTTRDAAGRGRRARQARGRSGQGRPRAGRRGSIRGRDRPFPETEKAAFARSITSSRSTRWIAVRPASAWSAGTSVAR